MILYLDLSTDSVSGLDGQEHAVEHQFAMVVRVSPNLVWYIAPVVSVCSSPAAQPTAAMGCCARPVIFGPGCWTATGSASVRRVRDRRLSGALPPADRARTLRGAVGGRGQVGAAAGTPTPGSRPPSADRNRSSRPGSHAANAALVPIRFYNGTFRWRVDGCGCRSPEASRAVGAAGPAHPLSARPGPAVTLLADGGRLWLAVTAAVPVQHHDLTLVRSLGGSWHHPSLCGGNPTGCHACVRPGNPGRKLPAPTRPAGPPS